MAEQEPTNGNRHTMAALIVGTIACAAIAAGPVYSAVQSELHVIEAQTVADQIDNKTAKQQDQLNQWVDAESSNRTTSGIEGFIFGAATIVVGSAAYRHYKRNHVSKSEKQAMKSSINF